MLPPDSLKSHKNCFLRQSWSYILWTFVDSSKILHFERAEKCLDFGRKVHQLKNSNLVLRVWVIGC